MLHADASRADGGLVVQKAPRPDQLRSAQAPYACVQRRALLLPADAYSNIADSGAEVMFWLVGSKLASHVSDDGHVCYPEPGLLHVHRITNKEILFWVTGWSESDLSSTASQRTIQILVPALLGGPAMA